MAPLLVSPADVLAASPAVLLVLGAPGSRRFARLEASAAALRRAGRKVTALELDLEGFESDTEEALARFLAARVVRAPELVDRAARLAPLAAALPGSQASAALLAALLAAAPTPDEGGLDLPFEPWAALREVLRAARPEGGHLWLFVRGDDITGTTAGALARMGIPGLSLMLAVVPGEEMEVRLLLPGSDLDEIPRLALEEGEDLSEAPLAPLASLFDRLELDTARQLEAFLDGAALLAPNAPADVAAFLAGRGQQDAEELLDKVDEELADGAAERILWDYQYGHPSFPGQPVYRFVRSELARAIVGRLAPDQRLERAAAAFERLATTLPADSRGRTRLLLNLARTGQRGAARRRLAIELALAFDAEDPEAARAHVTSLVAEGALAAREVLALADGTERRWPTARRLTIVSGLRESALDPEERAAQTMLEARFLAELGRVTEATAGARAALAATESAFGPADPRAASAANLLGLLFAQQGDLAGALPLLERTVETLRSLEGVEATVLGGARGRLGEVLRRLGRPADARDQFRAALELLRGDLGDAHPAVAASLNDLALASRDLGLLDEAASFHRQALEIDRQALGPEHPNVALDWNNLGSVEQQRGRTDEARRAFEQAVAVLRHPRDTVPPSLAVALANLAGLLFEIGERAEGCARLTEAARLAEPLFGADHPLTRQLQSQVIERCG